MISLQPEHKSYDSTVNLLNHQQEEGSYLVFLRGSATVGHYLTAGIFDNDGLSLTGVTINYQWQQSVNGNWIDIVGETAQSLTLTNSLLRQQVRVLASYIDALNSGKYVTSSGVTVAAQNAIVLENQKAGTTAWKITNLATNDEIAGYGDATSINKGQALNLKISLAQAGQYRLDVYRLGYYGGKGGRLITSVTDLNGVTQADPSITNASTNLVECKWNTSYTLQTGTDWTTGLYLVKLTDSGTGKQNYIQFVLRDDNRPADLGFQDAVATAQAYNNYGGYSVYDATSIGGKRAYQVSFDRPYAAANLGLTNTDGYNCNNMLTWEYNMTRWLESQGYDVSYYTNLDASTNPLQLYSYNIFLSVGHDEYWSLDERNNVEQARDNGINLAFFSANTAYWQVCFDPSSSGQANRVMTIYKDISGIGTAASIDPIAQTNPLAATTLFRSPEVNQPENALLGVGYVLDHGNIYRGYDFVVSNAADPYYANTGLKNGDKLRGLVGYEWDALLSNGFTPPGLVVLSQSPVRSNSILPPLPPGTNPNISNAVRYTAASGAKVFSTGSIQWVWGLDSDWVVSPLVESVSWFRRIKNWLGRMKKLWIFGLNSPQVTNPRVDSRAQQIAVNVFADMGAKPQTPSVGIVLS
ncbi:N,N-dimethylformamidase beta subunit family domain-containing protein [Cuspidothrix issatschenkoi]|uniref:Ig domain-containing protein group 1 domain-containing protein n=1 Tax=Cuspidothrix issatschenkoi CHARLIE-1 TaxID=2052836 RepID=A0A2S6CVB4_9CYAN|nr:N,N-dimethylformamidase beta subunit family domain-containing protein [Cuspidothrix issatschenkoi]PPJ63631.1 Ig domain-containing protein group 1 domain-containing protein [Cuspidothrix issatschenkoi CHARLIE-1]